MAENNTKIEYDVENDILWISKGGKAKASIEIGDFIIDVDHQGFIKGVEILNASEYIASKAYLENINRASMTVTYRPNIIYILIVIKLKETEKEIIIPITADLGHGRVITEKTEFIPA